MDVKSIDAPRTVAELIEEETASFQARNLNDQDILAAEILDRCYKYRRREADAEETFEEVAKQPGWNQKRSGAPWLLGDLRSGTTGGEFIYAYLPVTFVRRLLDIAERQPEWRSLVAETVTTSATVYFLNNVNDVLDEAMANLLFEASIIMAELVRAVEEDKLTADRERFQRITKVLLSEGAARRKKRLERSLWEINPRFCLASLGQRYRELLPSWQKAAEIYRMSKRLATWKEIIYNEILQSEGIELPMDLVCLLSPNPDDRPVTPPDSTETTPSGLALEHAARQCGIEEFRYSSGHLRNVISAQEKRATKT